MATVSPVTSARAPRHLGEHGRKLWLDVIAIMRLKGRALLLPACEALDRLKQVQVQIDTDGHTVPGYKKQPRPHPLLSVEADQSGILLACFRGLSLD